MTRRDIALVLFVIIIWASNFVAVKIGVEEMPALLLLALRFSLTGLLFLPFLRWPGLPKARVVFEITFLMSILHQGLMFVGLSMISASMSVILIQSQVIFSVLIAWVFFKEKIGWRTWAGITIGLAGIMLTVGGPDMNSDLVACAMILLSALFVSLSYFRMKSLQDIHPATYIALLNLFAAPFLWVFYAITDVMGYNAGFQWQDINWIMAGASLAFQVCLVSLAHMIWQQVVARNEVSKVTPYTLLMPIFGIGASALILQETITWIMLAGGFLTMVGVTIITYRRIQKGIEPHPETE